MLGEAVLDLVTYFLITHGMKKQTVEKEVAMLEAMAAAAKWRIRTFLMPERTQRCPINF